MVNSTCSTPYPRFSMSVEQRVVLVTYNILINGIVSFLLNLFIITALYITKQTKITAMKIVLYISFSDVLGATSVSVLITSLLVKFPVTCHHNFELITLFFLVLTGHSSSYGIALTAYDRWARVKLANNYKTVMTPKKVHFVLFITSMLALFVAILFVAGNVYGFSNVANLIVLSIDTVIMVSIIVCYIKFNKGINRVGQQVAKTSGTRKRRSTDRSIIIFVRRILLALAVIYFLYFITVLLSAMFYEQATGTNRGWLEVIKMVGIFVVHSNSAINAVIFISGNKKCKHLLQHNLISERLGFLSSSSAKNEDSVTAVDQNK